MSRSARFGAEKIHSSTGGRPGYFSRVRRFETRRDPRAGAEPEPARAVSFAGDSVSLADRGDSSVATLGSRPKEAPFAPRTLFRDAPLCSTIDDGGASLGPASLDNGAASLASYQDAPRTAHALRTREAYLVCPRAPPSPRDGGGRDAGCFDATVDDDGPSFLNGPVIDALASTGARLAPVEPRTPVRLVLADMSISSSDGTPFALAPPMPLREAPPEPEIPEWADDGTVVTQKLSIADGAKRVARALLKKQSERKGEATNIAGHGLLPHVAKKKGLNDAEDDQAIRRRNRGPDADLPYLYGTYTTASGTNTANGA